MPAVAGQAVDDRQIELRVVRSVLVDHQALVVDQVQVAAHAAPSAIGVRSRITTSTVEGSTRRSAACSTHGDPSSRCRHSSRSVARMCSPSQARQQRQHLAAREVLIASHANRRCTLQRVRLGDRLCAYRSRRRRAPQPRHDTQRQPRARAPRTATAAATASTCERRNRCRPARLRARTRSPPDPRSPALPIDPAPIVITRSPGRRDARHGRRHVGERLDDVHAAGARASALRRPARSIVTPGNRVLARPGRCR